MRSMLFVPGDKEKMLLKSLALGADSVIWDLEDAVALTEKQTARATICKTLQNIQSAHVPIYIRVNSLGTNMLDVDLDSVVQQGVYGILFPKAESSSQVKELDSILSRVEKQRGLPEGSVKVQCLLETCLGIIHAYAIASASPRVEAVCFGAEDFTLDLGTPRTRDGIESAYSRAAIAVAAGAAKVLAIDSVYSDLNDEEGLVNECRMVRQLGYRGKFAIHPKQLDVINREFSPSESELAFAQRIMEAFNRPENVNAGVITVDGKMIDAPILERARRLVRFNH
ncbi:MAG: CoA ester lyase [Candidatus Korobacteraceae bacterium]|jgi:citrate lyase subunit beta/citryl-CoA lyase